MGAWIETEQGYEDTPSALSHPSWVRGLKQGQERKTYRDMQVAPLVGAWIETLISL